MTLRKLDPARLPLSFLRFGDGPLFVAQDEFDLDIFLEPQHPLSDIALRHSGGQKLIGEPAAFGLPEFYCIRAMPPAEFTGAALDIGGSGTGGESDNPALIGDGAAGHFSSHRTEVPLILFVVYGTMVNAFYSFRIRSRSRTPIAVKLPRLRP